MRHQWLLALLFLATALPASAAGVAAGFVPGTVWLNTDTARAGETVRVATVLYDGSPSAIEGSVSFGVDGVVIGTAPFSLDAGDSDIVSVEWIATAGEHRITAEIGSAIDTRSKTAASLANASTSAAVVTVLPALPKKVSLAALDTATGAIASSSPVVAAALATAKGVTESIRTAGANFLETQGTVASEAAPSASSTDTKTHAGEVLGAETYAADTDVARDAKPGIMAAVARALLPAFAYPAVFYPLFFLILILILWLLAKRLRHPENRRKR